METYPDPPETALEGLVKNVGDGFMIGGLIGSFHGFINGVRANRFNVKNGLLEARIKWSAYASGLAVLAGLVHLTRTTMGSLRGKDDPWNHIISWSACVGIRNIRKGLRVASRSALSVGVFTACFEGLDLALLAAKKYIRDDGFVTSFSSHHMKMKIDPPSSDAEMRALSTENNRSRIHNFKTLPTPGVEEQSGKRFGLPQCYLDEMASSDKKK